MFLSDVFQPAANVKGHLRCACTFCESGRIRIRQDPVGAGSGLTSRSDVGRKLSPAVVFSFRAEVRRPCWDEVTAVGLS